MAKIDERSMRRIEEYARVRDLELKQANERTARRIAQAEADYKAELQRIENTRKMLVDAAFVKFERCQEAVMNFVSNKADRDRIKPFGLELPFLHDVNLFGRPERQQMADTIAARRAA